jgi:hypothetical protein
VECAFKSLAAAIAIVKPGALYRFVDSEMMPLISSDTLVSTASFNHCGILDDFLKNFTARHFPGMSAKQSTK